MCWNGNLIKNWCNIYLCIQILRLEYYVQNILIFILVPLVKFKKIKIVFYFKFYLNKVILGIYQSRISSTFYHNSNYRLGDVMISVFTSSVVDCGLVLSRSN
jgi:hypothetical protein